LLAGADMAVAAEQQLLLLAAVPLPRCLPARTKL